jgi:hypothetical protein
VNYKLKQTDSGMFSQLVGWVFANLMLSYSVFWCLCTTTMNYCSGRNRTSHQPDANTVYCSGRNQVRHQVVVCIGRRSRFTITLRENPDIVLGNAKAACHCRSEREELSPSSHHSETLVIARSWATTTTCRTAHPLDLPPVCLSTLEDLATSC